MARTNRLYLFVGIVVLVVFLFLLTTPTQWKLVTDFPTQPRDQMIKVTVLVQYEWLAKKNMQTVMRAPLILSVMVSLGTHTLCMLQFLPVIATPLFSPLCSIVLSTMPDDITISCSFMKQMTNDAKKKSTFTWLMGDGYT